jgi:hypothetical protein
VHPAKVDQQRKTYFFTAAARDAAEADLVRTIARDVLRRRLVISGPHSGVWNEDEVYFCPGSK